MDTVVGLFDNPGIAALTTLLGVVIGYLLQPLTTRRIRQEEEKARWKERARHVSADVDSFLRRMWFDINHEASVEASQKWLREVERTLLMLRRFYPDEKVRQVASALWGECRQAVDKTLGFQNASDADTRLRLSERQKEDIGEANLALDKLVELLGGESAHQREEVGYTLRSDRLKGFRQSWEKKPRSG
jgi:hypothetical protein